MPMWDFYCPVCDHKVELSFKRYEDSLNVPCPKCKEGILIRLASSGYFVLKGSGFHKNDYPK